MFSGTNESGTASFVHSVPPTAAYFEKDGTFVNRKGRVQTKGLAFPPISDSRATVREGRPPQAAKVLPRTVVPEGGQRCPDKRPFSGDSLWHGCCSGQETMLQDIRFALRLLARKPAFTAVAVGLPLASTSVASILANCSSLTHRITRGIPG